MHDLREATKPLLKLLKNVGCLPSVKLLSSTFKLNKQTTKMVTQVRTTAGPQTRSRVGTDKHSLPSFPMYTHPRTHANTHTQHFTCAHYFHAHTREHYSHALAHSKALQHRRIDHRVLQHGLGEQPLLLGYAGVFQKRLALQVRPVSL